VSSRSEAAPRAPQGERRGRRRCEIASPIFDPPVRLVRLSTVRLHGEARPVAPLVPKVAESEAPHHNREQDHQGRPESTAFRDGVVKEERRAEPGAALHGSRVRSLTARRDARWQRCGRSKRPSKTVSAAITTAFQVQGRRRRVRPRHVLRSVRALRAATGATLGLPGQRARLRFG